MPKLDLALGRAAAEPGDRFEVVIAGSEGEQRLPLVEAWSVPFETCQPVREFPSYKGQRHFSGRWWTATTSTLVGYESWLERDTLVLLDFDVDVVGIASQPFWLFWSTAEGKRRSHAPDFVARRADGSLRVLDCRHAARIKPRDQVAFDATRTACELMGWSYDVVDAPDEVLLGNLRWLGGYRHPRHHDEGIAHELAEVFDRPGPLFAGAETIGNPVAVLPRLFHLLWRQRFDVDLRRPLSPDTLVGPGRDLAATAAADREVKA